jgi:hypothetical protein
MNVRLRLPPTIHKFHPDGNIIQTLAMGKTSLTIDGKKDSKSNPFNDEAKIRWKKAN